MKAGKCLILMFLSLWVFGVADAPGAEPSKIRCVVGFSSKGMASDVDPRDAAAALRVWAKEMGDPYGFQVETFLYESVDKLIRDFKDKKFDFAMMSTVDYLRSGLPAKYKSEMALSKNGKTVIKYVLLTRSGDISKGLTGLKNKNLAITKINHLGLIYVDVHLMQAGFRDAESFFSTISYKSKESQAILAVFFGQADACLVTDTAFRTMTELNPQVGQKLQVMAESPELVEAVGFFRKDYPQAYKETAFKAMHGGIKSHERGKQVMLLFNVDQMDPITDADLDSARKLLADYDRNRKKK